MNPIPFTSPFIGKTGIIHAVLNAKMQRLLARLAAGEKIPVLERRWLFQGPPGVGKTELAKLLTAQLANDPYAVEHRNGAGVGVDIVREWQQDDHYRPLCPQFAVKFVDEIDGVSTAALTDLRTYLDELSPHRLFVATTNREIKELQQQLQSRFQVFAFASVTTSAIAGHLVRKYGLAEAVAHKIAQGAAGNVRAAESDAITELDVQAAMQAAA